MYPPPDMINTDETMREMGSALRRLFRRAVHAALVAAGVSRPVLPDQKKTAENRHPQP